MRISLVRHRLAAAVKAHVVLPGLDLQCLGYVPEDIEAPTFYVGEVEINPNLSMGGDDDVTLTCRVLTSRADDRAGQELLDELLRRSGPTSIRAGLHAAKGLPGQDALGGACDDIHVQRIQGYRLYRVADRTYFGAEIPVRAIGNGTED